MYTWTTTRSGLSSMSSMLSFSTCSSVMVISSLSSRYAARVASPNGGNSEYLIGRNSGLVASVSAGRIIFTFMADSIQRSTLHYKVLADRRRRGTSTIFLHDETVGRSGNDFERSSRFTFGGFEEQKLIAVQSP